MNFSKLRQWFGDRLWTKGDQSAPHHGNVTFHNVSLHLDPQWKHERKYIEYIVDGRFNGPIAMDVWVYHYFIPTAAVVLDGGANLGFTALLAAAEGAAEVHCFEPDPRLQPKLRRHCSGAAFRIYDVALGEESSRLELIQSAAHNQGSTLNSTLAEKFPAVFHNAESVTVDVNTIDALFVRKQFDLLKLDIEGGELAALRGAQQLLATTPPHVVYVELHEEFYQDAHELLKEHYEHSYRIVAADDGNCRLVNHDHDLSEFRSNRYFTDPPSYIYARVAVPEFMFSWCPGQS